MTARLRRGACGVCAQEYTVHSGGGARSLARAPSHGARMTPTAAATTSHSMSLPPDQPPPASPPEKPKLTPEERRARYTDRLTTIRLRVLIFRELDDRDITTPAAIGEAPADPTPMA